MADSHKTLGLRIISAILGGGVLVAGGYWGGPLGLILICFAAMLLCLREYQRLMFSFCSESHLFRTIFIAIGLLLALAATFLPVPHGSLFSLGFALLLAASIWFTRNKLPNEELLSLICSGFLGLVYCVYFPSYAINLLRLENGAAWFSFMLTVVFFGDTFAYFGGRFFGKKKLMPNISPSKTIAGAFFGALGSCLCGSLLAHRFLPEAPPLETLLFCLVCGLVAQAGDLFVSLIKRVAKVKDSGQIMPGHGGALDRLDGVFISCPLVYAFALYCQTARIF